MYLNFTHNELDEMLSSFSFGEFMRNTIQRINKVGNFVNIKYFIDEQDSNNVVGIVMFNKKADSNNIYGRYWTLNKETGYVYFQDIKKAKDITPEDRKTRLRSPDCFIFI